MQTEPGSGVAGAQAIRRAMDVIRAVAQLQRSGASLSRVATATGLSASTAFRMLRSLTEEGMLFYDTVDKSYYLGQLAFEIGLATQGKSHICEIWQPAIEEISRRTRLTSYLMTRSGSEAVCLICVQGTTFIRAMPIEVGQRVPLGIGAGSVAILSTLDDEAVDRVLSSQEGRLNMFPGGPDEAERVRARVAQTRERGYAVTAGSVARGLSGVGVPVPPCDGMLQLAVSVSAVADAIDPVEAKQFASIISTAIASRAKQSKALSFAI